MNHRNSSVLKKMIHNPNRKGCSKKNIYIYACYRSSCVSVYVKIVSENPSPTTFTRKLLSMSNPFQWIYWSFSYSGCYYTRYVFCSHVLIGACSKIFPTFKIKSVPRLWCFVMSSLLPYNNYNCINNKS